MKPALKWLVVKETLTALQANVDIGPKTLPHPFKPLAIGYLSSGRAIGRLLVDDEPLATRLGDLAAQFGQFGKLVRIPADAQKIYGAHREIKVVATDLSNASNRISVALLGVEYQGLTLNQLPKTAKGKLYWINLYTSTAIGANATVNIADESSYDFMPLWIAYQATDRAELVLSVNGIDLMAQAADLAALFGINGFVVPIPRDARRVYTGRTVWNAKLTDLSGASNVVTVSLGGVQFQPSGR